MSSNMLSDNVEDPESSGDIHICGGCKLQFNSVKLFVLHKKEGCCLDHNQHTARNSNEISEKEVTVSPIVEEPQKIVKSTAEESAPSISSKSNKRFQCEVASCQYKTCYLKDLLRHSRTHTGEKPFSCNVCGKNFTRADKLKMHERSHTGIKPYKCKECDYATNDSGSLKKHLRVHSDERPFKCQICPYASRNSSQLVVHLRTHTGDSPFHCPVCDTKFKINSDLKRHLRMHTGEKPYSCQLCDYKCAVKGNLKTHMKLNHSTENIQQCPHCDFTTSSRRVYREHEKTHDAKAVKCQHCTYTCTTRAALRNHQRIHSTERPFKCTFCTYSSRQPGNVRTHIKKRHLDKLNRQKKIAKRSGVIGEEGESSDIKRSPRSRPLCIKSFQCTLCEAAFVREDSLRSHLRQHNQRIKQLEGTATVAVLQLSNPVVNEGNVSYNNENQTEGSSEIVDLGLQSEPVTSTNAQTQIIERIYHNSSTSGNTPVTTTMSTCQHPTQVIAYIQNSNQDNVLPTSPSILATLLKNNETVPSSSGNHMLTVDVTHPMNLETAQASLNTINLTGQSVSSLMYSLGIVPLLSVSGQNIAHPVSTMSNSVTSLVPDHVSGGIQYIVQTSSDNSGSLLLNRIDNNLNQQTEGSELQLLTALPPTSNLSRSDESSISTSFFNSAGLGSFLTPILVTSQASNQMQMTEIVTCNEQNNSDKNLTVCTKDCASMTSSCQGDETEQTTV